MPIPKSSSGAGTRTPPRTRKGVELNFVSVARDAHRVAETARIGSRINSSVCPLSGDLWPITALARVAVASDATLSGVRRPPADLRLAGGIAGATVLSFVITPVAYFYYHLPLALVIVLAVAVTRGLVVSAGVIVLAVVVPWVASAAALGIPPSEGQPRSGIVPVAMAVSLWIAGRSGTPERSTE